MTVRLAVGAVGAAIGGYFGGPTGAQLGFAVGSFIGGAIDPDDPAQVSGPRQEDLNVGGSTAGSPIKIGYGTLQVLGDPLWIGPIQEVANTVEQGGKGSPPTVEQTTYSLFTDIAYTFGAGPADEVLRIWMNSELIYDRRLPNATIPGSGLAATVASLVSKQGISFRFYKGDETQLPDPTIESVEGAGLVSAHRGLVYIVFDSLNLTEQGNRPPVVKAEIAYTATKETGDRFSDEISGGEGGIFTSVASDGLAVDHKRRLMYLVGGGAPVSPGNGLRVYNLDTLEEIKQKHYNSIVLHPRFNNGITQEDAMHVGDSGNIYIQSGTANTRPVIRIDPDTLDENARFGFESTSTSTPATGAVTAIPAVNMIVEVPMIDAISAGTDAFFNFLFCKSVLNNGEHLFILHSRASGIQFSFEDTTTFATIRAIVPLPARINVASALICTQAAVDGTITIYRVEIGPDAGVVIDAVDSTRTYQGVFCLSLDTIAPATWNTDGSTTLKVARDKVDGGLIFFIGRASSDGAYVFKWIEDQGVVWTTQVDSGVPVGDVSFTCGSLVDSNVIGWTDGSAFGEASLLDTRDGTVIVNAFDWSSITASANPVGNQFYHGPTQSVIGIHSGAPGQLGQLFLDRATGFGVTDGEIVSDVGTREGYDVATDFDVTELTNTMDGYLIGRPMTGRDALQPLGNAFDWDAVESDDKIVFKGRGRASTRTIQDTELLPTDSDTFSVVDETRIQEVELPETVTVSYIDKALDYDRNAQSVKRILNPDPTMRSESKVNIAFPIVMTADQARQIAEKILFTSWNERTSYKWKTTWEHIDLDPADVVTLVINGAIVTNVRARISSVQVDRDFSMEFSGFKEESFSFTSVATGQAHPNFPQQTVPGPAFTRLFLLDIPLIRDSDDVNRISSRLHIAMNGFTSDWPGGVLYESSDGVSYNYTGLKNTVGTSYGNVLNTLPPTDLPFQTDTATQLQVSMIDGSLSSVSQSQFLDNANAAVVGTPGLNNWEIILFRDAVLGADNIYTVSTLIRGRRGTDVNVNKHLEGEFFFVLDSSTLSSYFLDPSFLEVSRFYRGVGVNQILEDAETKALASNMNDLKPYSPVHLDAVLDGGNNIDISWVRRTRVGGAEPENGSDDTSLAEDSESYEIDIGFFDEHHDKTVLVVKADGVDAATATTDFSPKAHALTFGTDGAGSGGEVELDTAQAKFGASSIKFANSGSVNPADSFVSAPGANFSLFDKEFTVEAWVRFNATTGAQVIMSQYLNTGDERGWWLYKASGGDLGFDYTTDGTNGTLVTNTVTWAPAINTWYHVAVTRDANNDLRFFIDGAFVGSANIGTDVIFNSSATFHLGKWRSTDDLPLDGWLDDIRVTIDVARYTDENGFSPLQIAASEEGDVVRTLNSTVQSVQYDNADITTDFGSVPDNIQIRVYQMSAQVGRGFGTTLQTVI